VPPRATIDFETRSACNLRKHGTWRYSIHPSTDILCLVIRLPHWPEGHTALWHPAMPALGLEEYID
jgi:DNA polymerase